MIHRGKLAQIHVAKAQLGLGDDEYRALLGRVAGVSSAKELTDRNVGAVINELRRLGFKPRAPKRAGRVPNTFNKHEQMTKIEAQLADLGAPWEYAQAIAKQQFGIERIDWLRTEAQFRAVIAALDVEQEKRALLAAIDTELAARHQTRDQLASQLSLPARWQRDRRLMRTLLERFETE
ncbi:regulatory protein GemA [Salinicola sp. JS01]|uniref:regulatory protein GemA n=1 Tax=Salinicola sp. JS01 TaxID=3050071 RepID=UPI00255B8BCD|nr:regulatory protein GemA [Salinicola sp. JS01]WIX31226.1 regulatory protein GemA [Salinicola sp. JS01]